MYLRILKKDLKRKKTLNVILLIFMILAATFISSGVSTILTVTNAMDNYFDKAGLAPCIILASGNEKEIENFFDKNNKIKGFEKDDQLVVAGDNIESDNEAVPSSGMLSKADIKQQKYFDENDNVLTDVNDGEIYMPNKSFSNNGFNIGDKVTIKSGNTKLTFTVKGKIKDATMGSPLMGINRFVISDNDYKILEESGDFSKLQLYSVDTDDTAGVSSDMIAEGISITQKLTRETISTTYMMDMITAAVLLIFSVFLIIISLIIMRFTIVFTLQEEFREIGIMKAIGIKESKIRGLYIIKYLALAVVGSTVGLVLSIPFQNMFTAQSSQNIVMSGGTGFWLNILSCVLLIVIVVLFCYLSTRRVGRFSPVDAVRSGTTGERFGRKGLLHLSKSHMRPAAFLAFNDILSSFRTFAILMLIFTLGMLLIIVPVNTISTLKSDRLVKWFNITESDLYLTKDTECMKLQQNGEEYVKKYLKDIEKRLDKNGVEGKATFELISNVGISYKDKNASSLAFKGIGTTIDQYDFLEGTPPRNENELALTFVTADAVGAKIGDTVKIKYNGEEKNFIVTAIYQSMNNLGEGVRFGENVNFIKSGSYIISFAIQITYTDSPSESEKQSYREIVEKLYPDFTVYSGGEYISFMMGNIADMLDSVKLLIVIVVLIINMLIAMLMVKTFLIKEKGEIAMLKSIGFKNSDVIMRQVLRIGIVLFVSILFAVLISEPISQVTTGKVFEFMGARHIDFEPNIWEGFVLYPIILLIATIISSAVTALGARKIKSSEINNID